MRFNRRLYEIHADFEAILQRIENAEGEIDETLESDLYKIELERDKKLENCCAVIKNARAEAELYDAEIKRLRAWKTRQEKIAERVEKYIEAHLIPGESWANGVHRLGWRKSQKVDLADGVSIDEVPDAYKRVEMSLMRDEVKKDLPRGEDKKLTVPAEFWFVKVIDNQSLQVK